MQKKTNGLLISWTKVVFFFCMMLIGMMSFSQQRTIAGKVTDSEGVVLPGVAIVVAGTAQGTVTNTDGEYSLLNIPENATLIFSFVGMKKQEVIVGNKTNIDVTMEADAIGIEEVVAIGYGTRIKEA